MKLKEIEKKLKELRAKNRKQEITDIKREDGSVDYDSLIDRVREQLEQDILDLTERVESLEDDNEKTKSKTAEHDSKITDLNLKQEETHQKTEEHDSQIEDHEDRLKCLEDKVEDMVDQSTFNTEIAYIKNILKQLSEGKEVEVQAAPPADATGMSSADKKLIEKMLKDLETKVLKNQSNITGHDKHIEEIYKLLNQKADKSDMRKFRDEFSDLANQVKNMLEKMKSLEDRVNNPELFNNMKELIKKLDEKVEDYNSKLKSRSREIEKNVEDCEDEIAKLKGQFDMFNSQIRNLHNKIENLMVRFDTLKNMAGVGGAGPGFNSNTNQSNDSAKKISSLKDEIDQLRSDLKHVKDESFKAITQINNELQNKASLDELRDVENSLHDRIDALEKSLQKAKNDLKRAIRLLDERVSLL